MKKSKIFQFFYLLILIVFITFGTALAVRSAELHRGNEFYEQIEEMERLTYTTPAVSNDPKYKYASLSSRLSQFAEKYPDAAIWLQLPDTPLDYPVMLGSDNHFYLNHLPDKNKNALGSLFLDCRTNKDSVHLIVYGHNGYGGKMFGMLKQYESQDYFLKHKTIIAATADSVYLCPIFSVRRTEMNSDAYKLEFEDNDSLINYIHQAAAQSLYETDVDLENAAGVLTLSTCSGYQRNQRFIVQALLPPA